MYVIMIMLTRLIKSMFILIGTVGSFIVAAKKVLYGLAFVREEC
jgi:hypothetical protein